MKSNTRQHILQRAGELFLAEGFATGIDRIVAECEIAKMTAYAHFTSKDGLIAALLQTAGAALTEKIRAITSEPGIDPEAQLEAVFHLLCHGMSDPDLRLGLGVRALIEFPRADHPAHIAGLKFQRAIITHLETLCAQTGCADSETIARRLLLIAQGCFTMAPVLGDRASCADAAAIFHTVVSQSAEVIPSASH